MCGRYATTRTATDLSALFEAVDTTSRRHGATTASSIDYNVAPTDPVPIVRMSASAGGRVLSVARWGLVPPWATDRRVGRPHDQCPGRDGRDHEGVREAVRDPPVPGPGDRLVRIRGHAPRRLASSHIS